MNTGTRLVSKAEHDKQITARVDGTPTRNDLAITDIVHRVLAAVQDAGRFNDRKAATASWTMSTACRPGQPRSRPRRCGGRRRSPLGPVMAVNSAAATIGSLDSMSVTRERGVRAGSPVRWRGGA
jgi:hypothetical protein